ncbi:MAG: class I SAM-dependent methyltransferase, partial [Porticoccaceae bacterium]|nr:class I SAM-dependent methyltransferase [Porticoccaceae bacterium]
MDAWGNFWEKGHCTTFGEYYSDGYTKGYIAQWWTAILNAKEAQKLNILEVGCGNASLLPCLLDQRIKGTYTGVDAAEVSLPDAVKKRANAELEIKLQGGTGIEKFESQQQFDLIASVYGLEYSPLDLSLPLLKSMLSAEGEANFLMHHAGSVITEMSVKALGEFDFELMESVVSKLEEIDRELNKLGGDPAELVRSSIAHKARDVVNDFVSSIMNLDQSERNPISVDFAKAVLTYFKKLRLSEVDRQAYISGILVDFHSSKERFR